MSEVPQSSYYFKYLEAQTVITEDIKITDPNFDNITVNNDAVFRQGIRVDTNLGDTESNVSTFTVSANLNKVGIGTETPNSTLHILNNTDTYQLKIANNNSDFLGINVDENNNTTFINNTSSGVFNFSNHINANSGMDITNNLKVQYDSNKILTINTDQNNNSNFSINNNGFFNFNNLLKANDGLIVSNNNLEIINQGITQTGTNEVNLSGNLKITNNTPVNDNLSSGALIVNGGAGVSLELKVGEDIYVNDSIYVGNDGSGDIYLKQDGGSIKFGDDSDVTIQHVHNSGLIISGNLTVNGTTTTINTDNSTMKDTLMELGNGRQDTPIANDSGIVILRNTSNNEDNAFIGFDESEDKFIMGTGTFTGSSTGNLTINRGDLLINDIICNNVSGSLTGNSATSTRLLNSRTIQATGDISWSVGFDGSSDVSGSATLNYIDFSTLSGISGILGVSNGGTGNSTGNAVTATALQTSRTIGGVSFDGSANINLPGVNIAGNQNTSGNAATATVLQTARNIGGVSFNGSTDIDLPGVNTIGDQDTNGNAATATTLETARNIGGVSFNGSTDIDLPGVNTIGDQDTSGNAATATTLATARNIGGVSFNGSTDIDLPGVNTIGDQDTSGNAATATTLETARTIGGVSFNGSTDIDLPGVNTIGDQDTSGNAATATTLETARNIGGVSFNGSIDIDLPGVNTTGNQDTTGSAASLTANYISGLTEGSLIDIVHTPNSDSNATIAVDLSEATDTTIVDGDYIVMLDGGIGGTNAKTSISNISNLFAGTGLTSTNSVLNIDSSQTQITSLGSLNGLTISSSNTVNMGNNRIQNVTDPISAQDAATKAYVDSSIQGLHILNACKAATTSNISLDNTTTTIDGVTLSNNDRVLVKDQTAGEDNGIYIVSTSGSWARSEDFNDSSEIDTGDFVFIGEGTINGSHGYVLTTTGSITLGTTLLEWTQFSGAGQIEAGNGLQKNNQLISVDLKTNGGLVIESQKLAVDLSGSSITGTLSIADGGTGATSAEGARTTLGVDPAGTDNSTDVTLTTVTSNYLSINGQEITAGIVPISLGGTGATSAADARTALGVDAAGTDNSTNVTLTNTDYLSISGQAITAGTVPISRGGTGLTSLGTAGQVLTINSGATALEWADSSSGTVTETFKTIEVSGQNSVVADSATDTLTLAAGTGMTITTDNSTDTITFSSSGGGTASNSFETISVSGQNSVVADSATDTLTLVAGTGMTITTDNSTDTITFSSSGGGTVTEAFKTISISGQSDVVADSATDTLTLVAGSGINLTTDANGDSITITNTGGGGGGGSSTFIGLSDTPSNFSGQSNKLLKVNSNENALEYVDKVTANPGSTTGQLSSIAIDGINYSISGSGGSGNSATEGALILDSYTVTANTNTQDITLDVGSSYADYEYFSLACVNLEGTLSGYIVWQPIDTSDNLHNTTTNSKWDITNITDTLVEALTQKNENYHILSYHTLGKQYINAKIFGLNLSDKKYSIFNSIGLHSTGTNTISQDGSTSQSSTTICQKIRINNYSTTNTKGSIRNGTFILYGHKKTGVISSNLLPLPTVSNATRTLQVKEDGSGYEFTDFVKGINNTGMHLLSRQHKTSAQSSSGWIFNITNYEDYDYFKLVGVNVRCSVNGALVWRGIKASDNTENMTNSEYSYIFSNIGSTGTGSNAGSNPGVNLTGSHLIADSTPGPVNFEVTIYGLNKSEQKYSTFHSSGQTSSTEYDNNTSYYYTGSTLQYGSSSSENYKCNGIKIYNNNSSNNFYGTIMLYGFRNNSNVVSTINYNGSELLDNKIIDTNSQNLILDCGSAYESYEYFELVCTNIQGTVNGYIGWQPYTSNPITTSTSTKWKTFTITDNTPDVTTNESKQWHILGFTTQGKQQIRSQIYNLNKVDKKYCKFNNIGLHSNTTDTISQEGSTSQIDNTKCRYIVINNFAEADTTNATGYISAGTIMLYGYKTNKSAAMTVPIPNPTFEDAGKVLQLDSTGTTIEYADKSIHNSIVDGDMIIGNDNDNIMVVNSKSEFNQEIKGNLRGDVVGKFEGEINNGNLKGTTIIGEDKDDLVIVNGDTKLLGNVNIGNNTNTEIKGNINIINNIKLNSTPLITQIHGFYQSKVNTNAGNQWLNHVAPSEAHITANSIKGMKSVVNMMPYALTFTSDADTEEETNFTFEIRARNDTSSDAALDTSNTTNRGTITLNNLTTSKGEMGLINNPSQISTNQNWGLYINSAVLSEDNTTTNDHFGCEFLVKVYFYQV